MFVLGTAGHVDHGKSVLVHALTGIDPDRLREEKERGMTIDLGFAWLTLPSGQEVGIIDVPGHEHFVKNMLAGVGGISMALLIVAANEGVMPQTREHLAILDLLGIRHGIVVVTKKDLVDEELLALVTMEIEELLATTGLKDSPVVPVSAITREGIPELVRTIDGVLGTMEPNQDRGKPRLLIDRIFTISGAGTVVTGTLVDGSIRVGDEVEILPAGLRSRLRGLQTHKKRLDLALPGSRVAANITGVPTSQLKRGDVLTRPGWLFPTNIVTAKVRLLPSYPRPMRYNSTLSFHCGASEVMARIRLLDREELKPGESAWAQIILSEPVAVINGDRFIVRSPETTLGGGEIIETHSRRYRRYRTSVLENLEIKEKGTPLEIIQAALQANQPQEFSKLVSSSGLQPQEARSAVDKLTIDGGIVALGSGERRLLFTAGGWKRLVESTTGIVQDYHRKYPMRPGIPRGDLTGKLQVPPASFNAVLQRIVSEGALVEEGTTIRLPSHEARLNRNQQIIADAFLEELARNPFSPSPETVPDPEVVNLLVRQGRVVRVSENVVFASSAYGDMVKIVVGHIREHGKITLGEARNLLNTSRKYAQALLEFLDDQKITRRVGDERILGQEARAA